MPNLQPYLIVLIFLEINNTISQRYTLASYAIGKWISLAICCLGYLLVGNYYSEQIRDNSKITPSYSPSYIYLVSAINHNDIDDFDWLDSARVNYPIAENRVYYVLDKNGKKYMTRAPGMSLCYLPAYVIGYIVSYALGFSQDGLSMPFVVSVALQNILVVLFGIWALYTLLSYYFKPLAVFSATVTIGLMSPLLDCVSPKEHMYFYLFSLLSFILLMSHFFYEKPKFWHAVILGFAVGLTLSIEFSALFYALVPYIWLISYRPHHIKARVFHILKNGKYYSIILLLSAIGGLAHLIYYHYTTRLWSFYNYDSRKFGWFWANLSEGLFSFNFGWLLYTPLMILALLGIINLAYNKIRLFTFTMIALFLVFISVFTSDVSNLSSTIGNSYMIMAIPILAFPLASLFEFLLKYIYTKLVLYLLFLWLAVFNFWLVANKINLKFVPNEGISPAYFWARILRNNEQEGILKLLDTEFNYTDTLYNEQILVVNKYTYCLTKKKQVIPRIILPWSFPQKYVRCYLEAKPEQTQVAPWRYAQLLFSFYTNGRNTKNSLMRIQRHTIDGEWNKLYLDSEVPKNTTDVHVSLWNADNSERICIRKITVVGYDVERGE